jgi:SAM-dependent methyltransferase
MLWLYATTIFLGAFLLFLVQPLFARMALPLLGGAPAVWNVAMVFYQSVLLAGYAYAHWQGGVNRRWWHIVLMLTALLTLPLALPAGWVPPTDRNPTGWLLALMLVTVGLPFFFVSATNPLLQRWFSNWTGEQGRDPYVLSTASNAGSLLALLAYPLLVERCFTLQMQSRAWMWGYVGLIAGLGACAWFSRFPERSVKAEATRTVTAKPSWSQRLYWIGLAFIPSSLMLSVTTYLTTEVGSMPLLWVIPLSLYLLSFVFVFSNQAIFRAAPYQRLMPLLTIFITMVLVSGSNSPAWLIFGLHLLALVIFSMACHGALAESRPAPDHLTEFYLWMAGGGVLGGAFNSLVAPLLFTRVLEYPISLVLLAWLGARPDFLKNEKKLSGWDAGRALAVGGTTWLLAKIAREAGWIDTSYSNTFIFGLPLLIVFSWLKWPRRFALGLAAIFLGSWQHYGTFGTLLEARRSFYGIHRVFERGSVRQLVHGTTVHGAQNLDPRWAEEPLTYYARSGPFGQMMQHWPGRSSVKEVGAIGLGVGSIAAYARPGENWTFFELDPTVAALARDPRYFHFLDHSPGQVRVVLGDGRLTIQKVRPEQFDLIILDAYSSDSLPVHLLTREALQIYLQKLAPGGLLAFHISNRYLDLEPVLSALTSDAGLAAVVQKNLELPPADLAMGKSASHWVIAGRNSGELAFLAGQPGWRALPAPRIPVWTDEFSSIIDVLGRAQF